MTQESTPESADSARPFKYHGKQGEFTLLAPLKPGGAEKAREIARKSWRRGSSRWENRHAAQRSDSPPRQRHSHVVR